MFRDSVYFTIRDILFGRGNTRHYGLVLLMSDTFAQSLAPIFL
jgi:hypothetical protein